MKNKKGFTLAEILAVIALISLVMFLVVPSIINLYKVRRLSDIIDSAPLYALLQQQLQHLQFF